MNNNFTNMMKKPLGTGSISGFKINDTNRNGRWNFGEKGIPGWTIRLTGKNDRRIKDEMITDENGFYEFSDLPAGNYIVTEEMQKGWKQTSSTLRNIKIGKGRKSMNNNFTNMLVKKENSRKTNQDEIDDE